jgi:hypothetical protein
MSTKVSRPASSADESGSKRRLRSIKREASPRKQGAPIAAPAGERRASRGTRLRQRHT